MDPIPSGPARRPREPLLAQEASYLAASARMASLVVEIHTRTYAEPAFPTRIPPDRDMPDRLAPRRPRVFDRVIHTVQHDFACARRTHFRPAICAERLRRSTRFVSRRRNRVGIPCAHNCSVRLDLSSSPREHLESPSHGHLPERPPPQRRLGRRGRLDWSERHCRARGARCSRRDRGRTASRARAGARALGRVRHASGALRRGGRAGGRARAARAPSSRRRRSRPSRWPRRRRRWSRSRAGWSRSMTRSSGRCKFREQLDVFLGQESPLGVLRADADDPPRPARRADGQRHPHARASTTTRSTALPSHQRRGSRRSTRITRRSPAGSRTSSGGSRAVGRALEPVDQAVTAVPDLQHQLAVLKSLADQVGPEDRHAGAAARGGGPAPRPDLAAHPARPRARRVAPPSGGTDPALRADRGEDRRGASRAGQDHRPLRRAPGDVAADRRGADGRPAGAQRPARADAEEQRELRAGEPRAARRERADRRPPERGEGMRGALRRARRRQPGRRRGAGAGPEPRRGGGRARRRR